MQQTVELMSSSTLSNNNPFQKIDANETIVDFARCCPVSSDHHATIMKFETYLLELLGLVAVGGTAALVTQVVSITPYSQDWSKAQNNAYFAAIPLVIYVAYRIYFGLSFFVTSLLPKQLKPARKFTFED